MCVCLSACLAVCLSVTLSQVEEKQRASVAFSKLLIAMQTLGFTVGEQKAIWHVLAGIYHLGAAGACRGNVTHHHRHSFIQRLSDVPGAQNSLGFQEN